MFGFLTFIFIGFLSLIFIPPDLKREPEATGGDLPLQLWPDGGR